MKVNIRYSSYTELTATALYIADFENQGAHHLAKKHDPEGKRTIGVLHDPPTSELDVDDINLQVFLPNRIVYQLVTRKVG